MRLKLTGALLAPLLALMASANAQDVPAPDEKADASVERAIENTPDVTAQDDAELTPEGGKKVEFETVPYVEEKAPDTSTIIPRVPGAGVPELDGTPGATMSDQTQNNTLADQRLRAGVTQPVLGLTETIQMVLQNNPQRAAARAQLEAALANVGIAKSAGGLQIDVSGSANTQRGFFGTGSSIKYGRNRRHWNWRHRNWRNRNRRNWNGRNWHGRNWHRRNRHGRNWHGRNWHGRELARAELARVERLIRRFRAHL